MALTLDELEKDKKRLIKPTVIKKEKKLMPWETFDSQNKKNDTISEKQPPSEKKENEMDTPKKKTPVKLESISPEFRNNSVTTRTKQVTPQPNNNDTAENSEIEQQKSVAANQALYALTGASKEIILYLGRLCREHGSRITPPITFSELKHKLDISSNEVVRVTIHRLVKKDVLRKIEHKTGKGGYQILEIQKHIYKELADLLPPTKNIIPTQSEINKEDDNQAKKAEQHENLFELPEEWMELNISGLSEKIHFGINQLRDLYQSQIDLETVSSSLDAFEWDFDRGLLNFIKTSPLNFIMGVLRKEKAYNSKDPKYKTKAQIAIETYNRKRREELLAINKAEEELRETEFKLWRRDQSKQDLEKIVGHSNVEGMFVQKAIEAHFTDVIWPLIRSKILS